MAIYRHWYIDCKDCGRRITLEIYTGNPAVVHPRDEKVTCIFCRKESTYSGDDFKTAEL